MSVDRSIEIEIYTSKKEILDFLRLLFNDYWTPFNNDKRIEYLAFGHTNPASISTTVKIDELYQAIKLKEKAKEFCLIHLWDMSHEEAYTLFIYPEQEDEEYNQFKLLFSLGSSKKLTGSTRQTDFSFYLEKIIPIFETNGFIIGSITCKDIG
jgi:hypothetical protein